MSRDETAWAAGLFEGEGTFVLAQRRARFYLRVVLEMTDEETVERFRQAVGGHHAPRPASRALTGRKTIYRVEYSGTEGERVATLLRPWLGSRRCERLDAIVAKVSQNPPTRHGTGWARRRELYGPTGRRAAVGE